MELQESYKELHQIIKQSSDARKARVKILIENAIILLRGGLDEGKNSVTLHKYLMNIAYGILECGEAWEGDEGSFIMRQDIEYAVKRARIDVLGLGEKSLTEKVREWVSYMDGTFSLQECYLSFTSYKAHEKSTMRTIISRLCDEGIIEKVSNGRAGVYRTVKDDAPQIDIMNIDVSKFNIEYPLSIHNLVVTQPKNIIIVAGSRNAGKTAFALNTAIQNVGRGYEIQYQTSEMGGTELAYRLKMFEPDIPYQDWGSIIFKERSHDFHDIILPDALNIIDYLKIPDKFWLVGQAIRNIFDRLNKGVAVICLQKSKNQELGVGGQFTSDEARLYITLDNGVARIVKAKNWRHPDRNPNNRECDFALVAGHKFIMQTEWISPDSKEKN